MCGSVNYRQMPVVRTRLAHSNSRINKVAIGYPNAYLP